MNITEHVDGILRYISVEPSNFDPNKHYPIIVLLHGFGSNMSDLASICQNIDSSKYVYICPNAPIAMDIGFGPASGYAWMIPPEGSLKSLDSIQNTLTSFIQEISDTRNVDPAKTVLAGFSQGGMLSYLVGLIRPDLFIGVAALSAWIPNPKSLKERLPETRSQSIFISHGTADTVVPLENARESRLFLENEGYRTLYYEYAMAHEIRPEVLSDLKNWLNCLITSDLT